MFEKLELTTMANAMANRAGARMGVIARNVANADTPGFKAMDLPSFAQTYQEGETAMRTSRAGHLGADENAPDAALRVAKGSGAPNGNTVSLEQEMVKSAEVRQDHQMALAIYRNASDLVRASLGRNR